MTELLLVDEVIMSENRETSSHRALIIRTWT